MEFSYYSLYFFIIISIYFTYLFLQSCGISTVASRDFRGSITQHVRHFFKKVFS